MSFTVIRHFGFACWRCRKPIEWGTEATTMFVPWRLRNGWERMKWGAHTGNTFIVHVDCGEGE